MSLHKKKMDKKLEFSKQNSRIDFGSLIFEASKQKDAEGLELILAQNGGIYIHTAERSKYTLIH